MVISHVVSKTDNVEYLLRIHIYITLCEDTYRWSSFLQEEQCVTWDQILGDFQEEI